MNYKIIASSILFIAIMVFAYIALDQSSDKGQNENGDSQIVLYYGDGCPHCAIVDEFVEENGIAEKVPFAHKEVYQNQANARELEAKAEICGVPTDSIGIPFLWDGEKCYIGDKDIIEFFKQRTSSL